ncbi:hypothetical protein EDB19DRAFT_1829488 [Suillus lakei]|nr:hypothetical protein EDB19DRAFT_1829488 [Suillus lakei]
MLSLPHAWENYHLGEGTAGGQFADLYIKCSEVLKGFASFVESTIIIHGGHNSEVEENVDESSEDSSNGSDLNLLEASKAYNIPPFNYNAIDYNSLQPADYEAAMSSFFEVSLPTLDFGMEASNSNLPPLPPVGHEVLVPPFGFLPAVLPVPQSIEPADPTLAVVFQPPAFQMTTPPTPLASQQDLPPAFPTPSRPPTPPASQTDSPPAFPTPSGPPTLTVSQPDSVPPINFNTFYKNQTSYTSISVHCTGTWAPSPHGAPTCSPH